MSRGILLKDLLASRSHVAAPALVAQEVDRCVRCLACAHRCVIPEGNSGICRVRFNDNGVLRVPWGYVCGLNVDPIEKKPFYHVRPGSEALSFGMLGCDFHCSFCQNWVSSQALRDPKAIAYPTSITPEQLVSSAIESHVSLLISTYNEPLITSDWAVEIFKLANRRAIVCGYVSNGHATPELLEFLRPHAALYKIDLKCFDERRYTQLGGKLDAVLDTIRNAYSLGFWVEVVTLVVPDFNDDPEQLRRMADFIAGVSPSIPWHVTAFHPDYKTTRQARTPAHTLVDAHDIGRQAGLEYVYAGNLPGQVGSRENTICPNCSQVLIERCGFKVVSNLLCDGKCPICRQEIPGYW